MEFQEAYGKAVKDIGRCHHHLASFSRQAQDQVPSGFKTGLGGHLKGLSGGRKVVPAVNPEKGAVIDRFYSEFKFYDGSFGFETGKHVEFIPVYAVRSCAYHKAAHSGKGQRFSIPPLQGFQACISIGKGLKIRQIAIGLCGAFSVEGNPGFQLLRNAFSVGVGWVEGMVVAKGASARREGSVTVGAGESAVHRQPLEALPVPVLVII